MNRALSVALLAYATSFIALPASATTVWTTWTKATIGTPGSASGTLNGSEVKYAGEVLNYNTTGTADIWASPASSFVGGTSTASPDTPNDAIYLQGQAVKNTITFSTPVVNPVFAIWSLGNPSAGASFTFDATPTFEAGGPDAYGGSAISVSGNVVSGHEGSGVVQFTGTFSSISWTDTPEYYYAFTVGATNAAAPEISSLQPNTADAGSADFTLTVDGTHFTSGDVVKWNSILLPTKFVSASKLTAKVSAAEVAAAGSAAVTVVDTALGDQTSTPALFAIPLTSIVITSKSIKTSSGGYAITLVLNNSGFNPATDVLLTGAYLGTTASATALPIDFSLIAPKGNKTVTLSFPSSVGKPGAELYLELDGSFAGGGLSLSSLETLP
jgi:hypothetical protein